MNRNSFMTLFTIFTISSFAMLDQGQAQTESRLEPARKSMSLGDGLQEACANGTFLYILCRQAGIEVGTPGDEYMKLGDIKGEAMKLGDIKGEFMKLGDIKGEAMSAPQLGGIAVGTPADEFTNAGDDDKIQQSSDDHYEVLFAGCQFFHVIPGAGGVLADIAAACCQLRLEGISDNED
ncbi:MAG: hypothetical protein OSA89_18430 [Mariniblastus sp.]|nr:hypothetical protein [Mariniblastus sp.]